MILNNELLDKLQEQAAASEKLRVVYDLRTTPNDDSQRMLNVLEPGTVVPIHRHRYSAETMIVLRGSITEVYYDDSGNETDRVTLKAGDSTFGIQIPVGQWHTVIVTEPVTIIEIKDGKYEPLTPEDLM